MLNWLKNILGMQAVPESIPDDLWKQTIAAYPFLAALAAGDLQNLRALSARFLADKEFNGAHDLEVTDDMAVAIAAQACLPVLHLGLDWYDDFRGIVVHPGAMVAQREMVDEAGVVHRYREVLAGEAMERGPVTLSWQDVAGSGESASQGYNVVIHEFVHKLDMRDGAANGCPPQASRAALAHWKTAMETAYEAFREQVVMAERFGAEPPWLDAYGATAPAEFFAVASEAYFVNRMRFAQDFAELAVLFDGFYKPPGR
ncbi:MAG: zinc-dependent peptidase [Comamonadaceae bacterium]|nr:MAG: zinc-dependent peptidase [Comamonadaceae bacterium]